MVSRLVNNLYSDPGRRGNPANGISRRVVTAKEWLGVAIPPSDLPRQFRGLPKGGRLLHFFAGAQNFIAPHTHLQTSRIAPWHALQARARNGSCSLARNASRKTPSSKSRNSLVIHWSHLWKNYAVKQMNMQGPVVWCWEAVLREDHLPQLYPPTNIADSWSNISRHMPHSMGSDANKAMCWHPICKLHRNSSPFPRIPYPYRGAETGFHPGSWANHK